MGALTGRMCRHISETMHAYPGWDGQTPFAPWAGVLVGKEVVAPRFRVRSVER